MVLVICACFKGVVIDDLPTNKMVAKSAPSRETASTTPTAQKTTLNRSSTNKSICPICDDVIKDSSLQNKGHNSVFCDGVCNMWGCAGLSKSAFKKIAASNDPFYCPHCSLAQHKNAIIEKLSSDLPLLTPGYS